MRKNILFDLDGTLTDPFEGITNSVIYSLKKCGIDESDKQKLKCFIGPPLYKSFMVEYSLSRSDALKAVDYYREYYADKGIFENFLYDGINETLEFLSERGNFLYVATSKPKIFAEKILRHFDISKYFRFVAGATLDSRLVEKSDIIKFAIEENNIDVSHAVMIGDRKHDILGAKQNKIKSIGVLYGYGTFEELSAAGADAFAEKPNSIIKEIEII